VAPGKEGWSSEWCPMLAIFIITLLVLATIKSWDSKFVGDISTVLHDILRKYMKPSGLYAYVASRVQSSGTGKSRVHDELAKRVLYIPLSGPTCNRYAPRLCIPFACSLHFFKHIRPMTRKWTCGSTPMSDPRNSKRSETVATHSFTPSCLPPDSPSRTFPTMRP